MTKASISISKGKGSIRHNTREFTAKNVDHERSSLNVVVVDEPLKVAYSKLFSTALDKYNEKQTRNDRKINSYYDHIRHSRQEKPFYELIVQVGNQFNREDVNDSSVLILKEFVDLCQNKYPNIYIFGAYVHLDEATPHLHLDYIPVAFNQKRGLETRNSQNLAMKQMGFKDYPDFREDLMNSLAGICKKYGIERQIMDNYTKHQDIHTFKKIAHEADKHISKVNADIDVKLKEYKLAKFPPEQIKRKDRLEYMSELFNSNNELYEKLLYTEKKIEFYKSAQAMEEKPLKLELANEKSKNIELKKELNTVKKENTLLKTSNFHFKELLAVTGQILSRIFKIPLKTIYDVFNEVKEILDKDRMDDFDKQTDLDYLVYRHTGELPENEKDIEEELEEELEI